ncbi:CocE/NonD family hydrolase [Mesorhizobium sp. M0187]
MIRKSWGGFSALQLAARRPKGLKAIVTVCSTDHRYAYDAHYMGGCLLNGTLDWGTRCFASMALPPDPEMVGKAHWRSTGMTRLENVRSILIDWVTHQREDEAWKHGSVCEAIGCAVLVVGGWADSYSNFVFRLKRHLEA